MMIIKTTTATAIHIIFLLPPDEGPVVAGWAGG
jgi:hypothetical protein